MTCIELFAGAGGMALGFEYAGIGSVLLVENNKDAVATLRANRPAWNVVEKDVRTVAFTQYADIVSGGFPCQTFSYAGNGAGFGEVRGTMFFELARCVHVVRPKIVVGENVRGLLTHDGGKTLATILQYLRNLGYNVAYKLLRAIDFGVPQKRERLIIIGVRSDLTIDPEDCFPTPTYGAGTLRVALRGCPESPGASYSKRKAEVLALVPPGGNWRDLPIEIQKSYMGKSYYSGGGKTGIARRLSWDEPSPTLTCSPAQNLTEFCHPDETRPLTVREYARIQTFPDNWEFPGSVASQYKQIGNAFPVKLGFQLGQTLVKLLSEGRVK